MATQTHYIAKKATKIATKHISIAKKLMSHQKDKVIPVSLMFTMTKRIKKLCYEGQFWIDCMLCDHLHAQS